MSEYIIMTDSNADMPQSLIDELDITVIPMSFTMCDKEYLDYPDHRDMSIQEFYDLQRQGNVSTTAALNPSDITNAMTPFLEQNKDVFYLVFSSGLSTTYRNACLAAEELREQYPDRKIIVVDSLAASMGQGLLTYHCVMQKRAGLSIDELNKWAEENKLNLCHWFTVNDLFHLKRGGRVSAAAAVLGSALSIKPVLHVDDEGHLINVSKVRGRKQSLDELVKHMEETATDTKNQVVFISHGDSIEDAQYVEKQIKSKMNVKKVYINHIGPIVGTHSGAGTIALFFMGSHR